MCAIGFPHSIYLSLQLSKNSLQGYRSGEASRDLISGTLRSEVEVYQRAQFTMTIPKNANNGEERFEVSLAQG